MYTRRPARRILWALFAPALAGALIGIPGSAAASTCVSGTGSQPPNPGSGADTLSGVAVLSRCNVWAVGSYNNGNTYQDQTLIEHWDGSSWTQVASPNPGGSAQNDLFGVAAISATNIWAVGSYYNVAAGQAQTLVVHWDGASWKQVPSPNLGRVLPKANSTDELLAVSAVSARDVWAVGWRDNFDGGRGFTFVVHWNGTAWKHVPSPNPGGSADALSGVAASSHARAWAVGVYRGAGGIRTLVLRWNGTRWKHVTSPNPGVSPDLSSVTAVSRNRAWAVGQYFSGRFGRTLILHWNGTRWKHVTSPNPGRANQNELLGVTAVSRTNAWAVGSSGMSTLVLHWNGTRWKHVASPNQSSTANNVLGSVGASARANVWAVGHYVAIGGVLQTLALRCC
jgi:hypothetical protein